VLAASYVDARRIPMLYGQYVPIRLRLGRLLLFCLSAFSGSRLLLWCSLAVVKVDTGMLGDTDKDRELSRARATVVRHYPVQNFTLDDTRIRTMGLGKSDSGSGKVEIAVYPASAKTVARR
jgi:hypothetical protein